MAYMRDVLGGTEIKLSCTNNPGSGGNTDEASKVRLGIMIAAPTSCTSCPLLCLLKNLFPQQQSDGVYNTTNAGAASGGIFI